MKTVFRILFMFVLLLVVCAPLLAQSTFYIQVTSFGQPVNVVTNAPATTVTLTQAGTPLIAFTVNDFTAGNVLTTVQPGGTFTWTNAGGFSNSTTLGSVIAGSNGTFQFQVTQTTSVPQGQRQCPSGQVVSGVNPDGTVNCVTASGGGGPPSGPAGGGLSGTYPNPTVSLLTTPSLGAGSSPITETWTVGSGGVTANTLVQSDSSNPLNIVAATTGAYGVAMSTVSSGNVEVARFGTVNCITDAGGATSGDLVILGTSTVVDCKDSGVTSSSAVSMSSRIIGVFRSSATAGNPALVELTPAHFGTQPLTSGTQGEPLVSPSTGSGVTPVASSVFYDAAQFSGDSSAKANTCASTASGTMCNASGLTGTPTVGTPISLSHALTLPSNAAWQFSLAGGTSSAVTINDSGSLFSPAAQNRMKIQNASTAGGMNYLMNVPSCCYFSVWGLTFYNPSSSTAGGAACNVASGADGSLFGNVNCLDYIAGENSWKISGGCCGMGYMFTVGNGNQSGGVTAAISSGVNGVGFVNTSWGHPASGVNVMTCNGTSVDFNMFNLYSEGNNSDTTTPFYAVSGCRSIAVFGNEVKAETASSTAHVWTLSNTFNTAFTLENFWAGLNFTLPAVAVENDIVAYCPTEATSAIVSGSCNVPTDSNGIMRHYGTGYGIDDATATWTARSTFIPNNSTGTTLHKLVKLTATGGQILTTSDTYAYGICDANCGTSSAAAPASVVATAGMALCAMDGNLATAPADYVIISQSIAGDCRDAGAARPTGAQIVGQMSPAATGSSSGNQWVVLEIGSQPAFGNTTGTSGATNSTPVVGGGTCCTATQLQEIPLTSGFFNILNQGFNIDASGLYTTASGQTPTLSFVMKACSVSGCGSGTVVTLATWTSTAVLQSQTNNQWRIIAHAITTATGASGAFEFHGNLIADLGSGTGAAQSVFQDTNTSTVGGSLNLASPVYLDIFVTTSTTNASNAVTQRDFLALPAPPTQTTQNWYQSGDTTTTASFSATNILWGLFNVTIPVSFSTMYYDVSTLDASNSYYLAIYSCPNLDCSQPSVTASVVCSAQLTVTGTGAKSVACTQTTPITLNPGTYILATTATGTTALLKAGNSTLHPFSGNTVTGGGGSPPGNFTTNTAGSTVVNTGRIAIGLH